MYVICAVPTDDEIHPDKTDGPVVGEAEDVAAGAQDERRFGPVAVHRRVDSEVVEGKGGDGSADGGGGGSVGRGCCVSVALAGHCDGGWGERLGRKRWEREALVGESSSTCVVAVVSGVERSIVPRLGRRLCGRDELTA